MCVCAHNKLLFRGTLNFITSGGPVQSLGQETELALPTFASSLFCGLWKFLTTFVPQFSTYEMGKQCLIYLWSWHLKGTRIGFCLADNAGYMQDWSLLCAGSFGECSATSQTFGFQLFVGSAQMFEYKHLFFFFWANSVGGVYWSVLGMWQGIVFYLERDFILQRLAMTSSLWSLGLWFQLQLGHLDGLKAFISKLQLQKLSCKAFSWN